MTVIGLQPDISIESHSSGNTSAMARQNTPLSNGNFIFLIPSHQLEGDSARALNEGMPCLKGATSEYE